MPGAFHVEVLREGDALHVYLLDVQIKNPVVADSSVAATLEQNGTVTEFNCEVDGEQTRFSCALPEDVNFDAGTLSINAQRGKTLGATATYELPFQLTE